MINKREIHATLVKNHNDYIAGGRKRNEELNSERNELKRTCLKAMGLGDEKFEPTKYLLDYSLVEKSIYLWLTDNNVDKLQLELVIDARLWNWKSHFAVMSICKGPQSILGKLCIWLPWARKKAELFPVYGSVTVEQFIELCKVNCYYAIHDRNSTLIKEREKFETYQTVETRLVEPTQGK
jgi:hypothetical protein